MDSPVWFETFNGNGTQTGAVALTAITTMYVTGANSAWAVVAYVPANMPASSNGIYYIATGIGSQADALARIGTLLAAASGSSSSTATATTTSAPVLVNGNA